MNRNDSASPRRAWRRLAIGAAAVVAAIGVATALRVATGRAPGEDRLRSGATRASDRDSAAPATAEAGAARAGDAVRSVRLSFEPLSVRRGIPDAIEPDAFSITIDPGPTQFEIALPDGYPDGMYRVAIVDAFDELLAGATGNATAGILRASADTTAVEPGRQLLRIERTDHAPDYMPIRVERR